MSSLSEMMFNKVNDDIHNDVVSGKTFAEAVNDHKDDMITMINIGISMMLLMEMDQE